MLESWNLVHRSRIEYHDDPWCQEWPHPPSLQSGTFSVIQVWLRGRGVLEALLIMLESWNLVHKSRITYHDNPWCQEWPSPPSFQSGTFNVLQVPNGASRLNHDGSLSNFQDIFLIIYQHDLWWKDDPHPPSLQSGTVSILKASM